MGAGNDIKKALKTATNDWTKQRKREERGSSAVRYRAARLARVRDMYITEALAQVIPQCYRRVSENPGGEPLPANVRQLYYAARPLVAELTDRPFEYNYFASTVLPAYIQEHPTEVADWDVVYDDRGHLTEPHTGRIIGLGTLNVRHYLASVRDCEMRPAALRSAGIDIYGPDGQFGALLYIEKEGFMPILERVQLAERYDIAIMSSKGMSVTAARQLAEGICSRYAIPLLVLHDFDRSGVVIKDTLQHGTCRYQYTRQFKVIDLGLTFDDIDGLAAEDAGGSKISDERLRDAGLTEEAINFLRDERVELNAMRSREFVDFVANKLDANGINKVIPSTETLEHAYRMIAEGRALRELFEALRKEQETARPVGVPADLRKRIEEILDAHPSFSWFEALQSIADPDALEVELARRAEEGNDGDDDDLREDDDDPDGST
jgi:hypothetical protein